MKNGRLTEDNLKSLDGKISKEAKQRDRKDAILADHKSQRSASAKPDAKLAAAANDDKVSVKSHASARSRHSSAKPRELNRFPKKDRDQYSNISSQDAKTEVFSELAEDDEWAAI
jgi:hypothetical protein